MYVRVSVSLHLASSREIHEMRCRQRESTCSLNTLTMREVFHLEIDIIYWKCGGRRSSKPD